MKRFEQILVTGGGGYVGAVLVPKLLACGYRVKVVDLFLYGENVLEVGLCWPIGVGRLVG